MKEMFFVVVVMMLIGVFMVFNELYILIGGGLGNVLEVLSMFLYKSVFIKDMMGYVLVIVIVVLIIMFVLLFM